MKPQITHKETLAAGHFITLELLHYRDHTQTERQWEAVQRNGNTHAVVIIATLEPDDKILLIRQYRPPLNNYVMEFPAGLIDPGESAAEAAVRELHEETGYCGSINSITPGAASSAGLTGEILILVFMSVDTRRPENQHPAPDLQDGEDIEVFTVPKDGLSAFLQQQIAQGDILDSRLAAWVAGFQMQNSNAAPTKQ
ncbi:MAG: NUDIX hydrolase [Lentisphaeria bacterium]